MSTQTVTFTAPVNQWTPPANFTGSVVTVTAVGGIGGDAYIAPGGFGLPGYISGVVPVNPGASVTVYVGQPANSQLGGYGYSYGGNGGTGVGIATAAGGGGSSALLVGGVPQIVAGGGGGGDGAYPWTGGGAPGNGGLVAGDGYPGHGGGGQGKGSHNGSAGAAGSPGGSAGLASPTGTGGAGGSSAGGGGGGGGGGWGGGGGGGYGGTGNYGGGGGGGSSYAASVVTNTTFITGYEPNTSFVTLTYSVIDPPLAPSNLSPANNAYADGTASIPFSWTYNPGKTSGVENGYCFRWKASTASAWSYWNATGASMSSSSVWNSSGTAGFTLPASVGANGQTYNWNVATQEASVNAQGPFANTDQSLNLTPVPTVMINTPGASVTTSSFIVNWSPSMGAGYSQNSWHIKVFPSSVVNASGFAPATSGGAIYDSGVQSNSNTQTVASGLSNSEGYSVFVLVSMTNGVNTYYSQWTEQDFVTNFDGPATPLFWAQQGPGDPTYGLPANVLIVQGQDNWLPQNDSSFESGTLGDWAAGANASVIASSTWAVDGVYSMRMSSLASGAMSASVGAAGWMPGMIPGASVTALAAVRAGSSSRTVALVVDFYTSASVYHASASVATGAEPASPTPEFLQGTALIPSGVSSGFATVRVQVNGTGAGGEYHYVDQIGIYDGAYTGGWSIGGQIGNAFTDIQYSDDQLNWYELRYGQQALPSILPEQIDCYDWEAVPNNVRYYRARVTGVVNGLVVSSSWSTVASTTLQTTQGWIIDPITLGNSASVAMTAFKQVQGEQMSPHYGIGVPLPAIVSTVVNGRDGTFTAKTLTVADWNTLQQVMTDQQTKWISHPLGDACWARIGPMPGALSTAGGQAGKVRDSTLTLSGIGNPVRDTVIQFVEVASP